MLPRTRPQGQILLVEEPEAHLHPQLQRVLLIALQERNVQVFITTHSTHITSGVPLAVQKQADHHLRRVGRLTAAILLHVRLIDGAQVKRRDHIDEKPSQVALRKQIMKRWGKLQRLVNRVRKEVLAHVSNLNEYPVPTLLARSPIYDRHTPRDVAQLAIRDR